MPPVDHELLTVTQDFDLGRAVLFVPADEHAFLGGTFCGTE
ncbi:MAG TPA: hypothetical protein VEK84_05010 [Terriglobales bacterium]|nr:hypothetical protein [Terriglobales bacterium]